MGNITATVVIATIILIIIVTLFVPSGARSEWLLMVDGKPKVTYPDNASGACQIDKVSEEMVRPFVVVKCTQIKDRK